MSKPDQDHAASLRPLPSAAAASSHPQALNSTTSSLTSSMFTTVPIPQTTDPNRPNSAPTVPTTTIGLSRIPSSVSRPQAQLADVDHLKESVTELSTKLNTVANKFTSATQASEQRLASFEDKLDSIEASLSPMTTAITSLTTQLAAWSPEQQPQRAFQRPRSDYLRTTGPSTDDSQSQSTAAGPLLSQSDLFLSFSEPPLSRNAPAVDTSPPGAPTANPSQLSSRTHGHPTRLAHVPQPPDPTEATVDQLQHVNKIYREIQAKPRPNEDYYRQAKFTVRDVSLADDFTICDTLIAYYKVFKFCQEAHIVPDPLAAAFTRMAILTLKQPYPLIPLESTAEVQQANQAFIDSLFKIHFKKSRDISAVLLRLFTAQRPFPTSSLDAFNAAISLFSERYFMGTRIVVNTGDPTDPIRRPLALSRDSLIMCYLFSIREALLEFTIADEFLKKYGKDLGMITARPQPLVVEPAQIYELENEIITALAEWFRFTEDRPKFTDAIGKLNIPPLPSQANEHVFAFLTRIHKFRPGFSSRARQSDATPHRPDAAVHNNRPPPRPAGDRSVTACVVCGTRSCPNNSTGQASRSRCKYFNLPHAHRAGTASRPIPGTPEYARQYSRSEGKEPISEFLQRWQSNPNYPARRQWSTAIAHLFPHGWDDTTGPTAIANANASRHTTSTRPSPAAISPSRPPPPVPEQRSNPHSPNRVPEYPREFQKPALAGPPPRPRPFPTTPAPCPRASPR